MRFSLFRPLSLIATGWVACGGLYSQTVVKPSTVLSKIEPGLDLAVNWKWWVAPPENAEWGLSLPEMLAALDPITPPVRRPQSYEVKKGDAIIKIARKFDMSATQLMQFNDLKSELIIIGQTLRIPTPAQVLTMIPPPPPPKAIVVGQKDSSKSVEAHETYPEYVARKELESVRLQVFLDREMFSPGMIDGKSGATLQKISRIYQNSHPDVADSDQLKAKAEAALKQPYTRYTLRRDDFKFINPTKAEPRILRSEVSPVTKKKGTKPDKTDPAPAPLPVTIDELIAEDFLAYENAWEFVAERFHCDEEFLHHINPQLKGTPVVGNEFQVPDVIPFEIEKALDAPLQPVADPKKPVTAAVVGLSWLEISREGKLIAVMPLTMARPGLRGRNKWIVLDAIPQPRLATNREPREAPKEKPMIETPPEKLQYLASGPNNPVGVIWINLAKSANSDPLIYGLHGTSIPDRMKLEGIGGLRLTNWDIARATRLMPVGTELQWKAR